MCIGVIGGMDRLERHYRKEADQLGVELRVFSKLEANMSNKLKHLDAMVIFTNKISHKARNEAVTTAKGHGIPVYMEHSCGVCSLRQCLSCILCSTGQEGCRTA